MVALHTHTHTHTHTDYTPTHMHTWFVVVIDSYSILNGSVGHGVPPVSTELDTGTTAIHLKRSKSKSTWYKLPFFKINKIKLYAVRKNINN